METPGAACRVWFVEKKIYLSIYLPTYLSIIYQLSNIYQLSIYLPIIYLSTNYLTSISYLSIIYLASYNTDITLDFVYIYIFPYIPFFPVYLLYPGYTLPFSCVYIIQWL